MECNSKKQGISIVRGTTNAFGITITDADGVPFTLEDGQSLIFGIKHKPNDEEVLLAKKVTHYVADEGVYYLELEASDTIGLDSGMYYYDVGLQDGGNVYYNVIEANEFYIKPNITKLGDVI